MAGLQLRTCRRDPNSRSRGTLPRRTPSVRRRCRARARNAGQGQRRPPSRPCACGRGHALTTPHPAPSPCHERAQHSPSATAARGDKRPATATATVAGNLSLPRLRRQKRRNRTKAVRDHTILPVKRLGRRRCNAMVSRPLLALSPPSIDDNLAFSRSLGRDRGDNGAGQQQPGKRPRPKAPCRPWNGGPTATRM